MERASWLETYSLGNDMVDEDHTRLLEIFKELLALPVNAHRSAFAKILSDLTDYSLMHFKQEEAYMRKMNYPGIQKHISEHKNYIYKVSMMNIDFMKNGRLDRDDVLQFIEQWWEKHILEFDASFETFKKESGINLSYK